MPTLNDAAFNYMFPEPKLDTRENPSFQGLGTFSKLSGVDGRYKGRLRRFPGFRKLDIGSGGGIPYQIGGYTIDSLTGGSGLKLFKGFAIQRDSQSNSLLRGFVFLGKVGSNDKVFAYYYRTSSADWEGAVLYDSTAGAGFDAIDVTWDHRHFYITGSVDGGGSFTKLVRYDGAAWQSVDLLPSAAPAYSVTPVAAASGKLLAGNVGFAYRFVYPEHDMYDRLSAIDSLTVTANQKITGAINTSAITWAKSRYVELYRTVSSGYGGAAAASGRLYLERIISHPPASSGSLTLDWGDATTGLSDDGLVQKNTLDPVETKILNVMPTPVTHVIPYEDTLFYHTAFTNDPSMGTDLECLRWSPLNLKRPNLIPIVNRRRTPDLSSQLKTIVPTGAFLAAVYNSDIVRIQKSGFQLAIDTVHNKFGSGGRNGALSIGSNLYLVSSVGLLLCDLSTGQLSVAQETQHIFDETSRWANDLDDLVMSFDSRIGALFIYNPNKGESLVFWSNEGTFTELEDQDWVHCTTTTLPVQGGPLRAMFVQDRGTLSVYRVYVVDAEGTAPTRTMVGGKAVDVANGNLPLSWNNVCLDNCTTTDIRINYTEKVWHDDHVGCYIRFLSGQNKGQRRKCYLKASTGSMTLDSALPFTPAAGDRFSVGAIPFRIRMWPLSPTPFDVDKVNSGIVAIQNQSGETGATNPNLIVGYQAFKPSDMSVAAAEAEGAFSLIPKATAAGLNYANSSVIPGIEQWSSNLQFDLTAARFSGSIESSVTTGG